MQSISIIIATRDRASALEFYGLSSLAAQSEPPLEVIIIDASDGDQSLEAVERMKPRLRCLVIYEIALAKGSASQRNQGIALAKGDILLFIDDDSEVKPDGLRDLRIAFLDSSVAGAGLIIENAHNPQGGLERALQRLYFQDTYSEKGRMVNSAALNQSGIRDSSGEAKWLSGCSMAFRREVFENGFRFNPALERFSGYAFGEDYEFSHRVYLSGRRLFIPEGSGIVHHAVLGGRPVSESMVATRIYNRYIIWRAFRRYSRRYCLPALLLNLVGNFLAAAAMMVVKGRVANLRGYFMGLKAIALEMCPLYLPREARK